jgi:ribA/ribD-fused uncharacterized protein
MPSIMEFQGEYRFLSNFWVVEENFTTEHYFQAAKTLDRNEQHMVLSAPTPGQAKREGRKVTLRSDWDEIKLSVMLNLTRMKFFISPVLKDKLLMTEGFDLFEGNTWHDYYWGVDLEKLKAGEIVGENHLGDILMQVRTEAKTATNTDAWIAYRELEWYMQGGSDL